MKINFKQVCFITLLTSVYFGIAVSPMIICEVLFNNYYMGFVIILGMSPLMLMAFMKFEDAICNAFDNLEKKS